MLQAVVKNYVAAPENDEATFADFWLLYPKRIARMEAEKAWRRLSSAQHAEAMSGLFTWRAIWIAESRLQFVPNASTWLNQQRWTDELPEAWGATHLSHKAAAIPETCERSRMPDHVRALLAKLRK